MPWEGHPQGVPLPIVLSRRLALGRAPTRGAPNLSCLGVWPWEGHPQGVPLPFGFSTAFGPGKSILKGRPFRLSCLGVMPWEGAHKGRPYRLSCLGAWPWEGTHKGRPYRLSCLGAWPWEGHPQGVPLPIVLSRRLALGRAPTRGAPTDLSCLGPGKGTFTICLVSALWPWEGHPQGVPLLSAFGPGKSIHKGAPFDCLVSALCPGKGTHKGCPYRLSCLGAWPWEGHPQGVPLPFVLSRRLALGRAPTRGAPTIWLVSAFGPGKGIHKGRPFRLSCLGVMPWEGAHKGCPYRLSCLGAWPWEGHPQGVPLPFGLSRRLALGRAPTRGAPTDCLV